jgi:thymidylate kinase
LNFHIELAGIPGAGKTTIYKQLGRLYGQLILSEEALWLTMKQGLADPAWKYIVPLLPDFWGIKIAGSIFKRSTDFLRSLSFFLSQNKELLTILGKSEESKNQEELLYFWLMEFYAKFNFINKNLSSGKYFLIDEGFIQKAVSLFAYGNVIRPKEVKSYIWSIPLPAAVFIVEAEEETSLKRIEYNERIRMNNIPKEEKHSFYKKCSEVIEISSYVLEKRGSCVIKVDNRKSIETPLRDLKRHIHNVLKIKE